MLSKILFLGAALSTLFWSLNRAIHNRSEIVAEERLSSFQDDSPISDGLAQILPTGVTW